MLWARMMRLAILLSPLFLFSPIFDIHLFLYINLRDVSSEIRAKIERIVATQKRKFLCLLSMSPSSSSNLFFSLSRRSQDKYNKLGGILATSFLLNFLLEKGRAGMIHLTYFLVLLIILTWGKKTNLRSVPNVIQ